MGARLNKPDPNPKWVYPLAAMLVTWDIVDRSVIDGSMCSHRKYAIDVLVRSGAKIFWKLAQYFYTVHLEKIRKDGILHKKDNIYDTIRNSCIEVSMCHRGSIAWRETIRMSEIVDREIYAGKAGKIDFDEARLGTLLDNPHELDEISPIGRMYYLYSVGEALVSFGQKDLIDRWYEILEDQPFYLPMIVSGLTVEDITICIPQELIDIVISYSGWRLLPRTQVMNNLQDLALNIDSGSNK
ncbi:MAG: hypothetical protein Harvfovirus3_52 [Harvfovirus sp.]|uniref:Uncharacterized protein n=1 Tax=Harvfovirus sp. TaxID=2487768 RepID=A0A3G5A097_9VIRU|nr:MAG: hypothetical protein Harvfovirus3_52 [Harvfovirus sp.]